jgi:hypothetical protein
MVAGIPLNKTSRWHHLVDEMVQQRLQVLVQAKQPDVAMVLLDLRHDHVGLELKDW